MKTAFYVVAALLAGLVLGSWSVKSDLRKAQQEITVLKEQSSHRVTRQDNLRNITSLLRVPEATRRTETPVLTTNEVPVAAEAPASTTNAVESPSLRENIQLAIEAWKTRSALARTGFLSNINASPVQTQMFDKAVEAMNKELGEKIQQWANHLRNQADVTPETGLRMMNDLSTVVVKSYDELDRVLAPGWREQAGDGFQLFDYINPEVALPLADLENRPSFRFHRQRQP